MLGYARSEQKTNDLYGSQVPTAVTSLRAKWKTYGAYLGGGLSFELAEKLHATPIVNFGIAHLKSEARYGGAGAAVTAALLDGIAFNWDAYSWSVGTALRVDWERSLGGEVVLFLVGRYDLRWLEVFGEDDPAQDFSESSQTATLRIDATGPLERYFERDFFWRATVGYRRYWEGDLVGVDDVFQVGGAIEADIEKLFPLGHRMALSASVFFGPSPAGASASAFLSSSPLKKSIWAASGSRLPSASSTDR